jgi:hypothetical protein
MKKIYIFMCLFALSGCGVIADQRTRNDACSDLSVQISKDSKWKDRCSADDKIFMEGIRAKMMIESPQSLCQMGFNYNGDGLGNVAEEGARKRKISCAPYYKTFADSLVDKANIGELCSLWAKNTGPKELRTAVRSEVKARSADCPALMAAVAQENQAIAQQAQARASAQAAAAAIQANIQNNINANRPKTCYGYGNYATCY